jgi:hypothetical protein
MPEASQYMFNHRELVTMMVKATGLHEGKWMLSINFGFAAINAGPGPDQMNPTAMAGVHAVGLQKAAADSPPSLVVDAAEVNPHPPSKKN